MSFGGGVGFDMPGLMRLRGVLTFKKVQVCSDYEG